MVIDIPTAFNMFEFLWPFIFGHLVSGMIHYEQIWALDGMKILWLCTIIHSKYYDGCMIIRGTIKALEAKLIWLLKRFTIWVIARPTTIFLIRLTINIWSSGVWHGQTWFISRYEHLMYEDIVVVYHHPLEVLWRK